jgi:pentatricopeptide repeat protein
MLEHGPKPSLVTWNTLMSAYAKLGRHAEARALLLRLRENGKRPDVVSYSTLLSAYAKAGLSDEARGVSYPA